MFDNKQVKKNHSLMIGDKLRLLRTTRGYPIKKVSKIMDISVKEIKGIENGSIQEPSVATIEKLAECYGCYARELMDDARDYLPDMIFSTMGMPLSLPILAIHRAILRIQYCLNSNIIDIRFGVGRL